MRKQAKHSYSWTDFHELNAYFNDYIEHRLTAYDPHHTFKRYLVSRRKQCFCDLYDDYRYGLTQFPKDYDLKVYCFSTLPLKENTAYGLKRLN